MPSCRISGLRIGVESSAIEANYDCDDAGEFLNSLVEQSIRRYIDTHNVDPMPFVWTKSADTILASVAGAAAPLN